MVFTSHIFIFYFLPLVLLIYYALPGRRNIPLLVASYVFYGWWEPKFLLLMLFNTVVNYVCGRVIAASPPGGRRRTVALACAVVASLGLLGFFKYFMFLEGNLNRLLALFGAGSLTVLQVTLPVGISFYTFASLTYVVDVYRGACAPAPSFWHLATFISMFPQIMAGPIVRYHTIAEQLVRRTCTLDRFSAGVTLFMLGFAKKVLLANEIQKVADAVFSACSPGVMDAWVGVVAFAFQLYFDFSGYSDMAIGLARMLGFDIGRNFDAPYLSDSITDFWRRWHISLSTFFREYLYIPLGGNRKGARRTYFNLWTVMLLCGLWHGANWTFIFWGGYHGAFLILERWTSKRSLYAGLPRPARVLLTFGIVLIGWVFFRSPTFADGIRYLGAMVGVNGLVGGTVLLGAEIYTPAHLVEMVLCAVLAFTWLQAFDWSQRLSWAKVVAAIPLFVISVMTMFTQAFSPFLYFQF
jgi:alginate O-acetyltransferase complex protein AlgI